MKKLRLKVGGEVYNVVDSNVDVIEIDICGEQHKGKKHHRR